MIRLERIDKSFGSHRVLSGIDLALQPGSVTALIGPSGSGKSTLLRCVNLLEVPEAGALSVGDARIAFVPGRRPSRDAVFAVRKQTGMVFQNFQLFPHLSVVQNVMEGLVTVQRWPREQARQRALALLDKVGIAGKADAWPATLSGGQQQRVAIARACAVSAGAAVRRADIGARSGAVRRSGRGAAPARARRHDDADGHARPAPGRVDRA